MGTEDEVLRILREVLAPTSPNAIAARGSRLLGAVPELDSTSVVTLITAIEERFGIAVAADEIDASTFETVGTLADFVARKLSRGAGSG